MMFFNVPEARGQLLREGIVYTLRPKLRREGKDLAVYGSYFKNEKLGYVAVKYVGEINDLAPYLPASGFVSLKDWLAAAKGSRFLYEVKTIAVESSSQPVRG